MLLCLLTVPTASAEKPDHAPYGPVNGEGSWLEDPGGGVGGDGGDPDELVLTEPPDHVHHRISDDGENLSGEALASWDFLRLRVWWLSFVFWSGMIR